MPPTARGGGSATASRERAMLHLYEVIAAPAPDDSGVEVAAASAGYTRETDDQQRRMAGQPSCHGVPQTTATTWTSEPSQPAAACTSPSGLASRRCVVASS